MPLEDFLGQVANLWARTEGVTDAFGAVDREPYVQVAANLACCVRPLSALSQRRNDRAGTELTHRVYFAEDADFKSSRRLTVEGRTFEIVGAVDYNSLGRLLAVDCQEIVE